MTDDGSYDICKTCPKSMRAKIVANIATAIAAAATAIFAVVKVIREAIR